MVEARVWLAGLRAASLLVLALEVVAPVASAASAGVPAPVRPALPPVSLHAWAKVIGAEVSWLEKPKKLRLKNAFHEVVFEADRREVLIDGVRVFLGEAPQPGSRTLTISSIDRDRLLLPLLAPHRLNPPGPVRVVMLDAGHGGKDKGTTNAALKLLEKDLALDVVRRLQPLLELRGYRVLLTRADDRFIELGERPQLAARAGADLFLAVHFNAGPPTVTGIETYTLTPQYQYSTDKGALRPEDDRAAPGNAWGAWNTMLGFTIHRQLVGALGRFDRGLKRARFVVIRDLATCPGVLIECGYLSNADEAKLIAEPTYREKIAEAIAAGVDAYTAAIGHSPPELPSTTKPGAPAPGGSNGGAIRPPRANTAKPTAPPGV